MNTEGLYVIKTIKGDEEAEKFLNMMTEQGYFLYRQSEMKRVSDVNYHTFFFREHVDEDPWYEQIKPAGLMSKEEFKEKTGIDLEDPIPDEHKG